MATDQAPVAPLIAAVEALGPLLREHADQGERDRRLPGATVKALTDAGVFRLCRPRLLGGLEADPLTVLAVVEEISRHDGSAGWCAVNCGLTGLVQSLVSPDGVREIGSAPDMVANGIIAPSGRARVVDGGFRVSGRWAFVSNCEHCAWLVPTSVVFNGDAMSAGAAGPEMVMTWMHASDCRIIDTWQTSGLRATGSHDIEVSDVFVPAHRSIPVPLPVPVADGALFRFPIVGLWAAGIAASALGIARAAIDELLTLAATKTPFGSSSTLSTKPTAQIEICETTALLRSARALLVEETARVWEQVQAGTAVTPEQRGLLRIAATHATVASAQVVDRMYTAAGATAIFASSLLQRYLRDIHAVTQHHFVAPPTYEMVGKILLGVERDGFML